MNEIIIQSLARMIVMEWVFRALLIVGGLASAGFFHCSANFLTAAPHTVKALVLPIITGCGVGMAFFGFRGDVVAGALVSVVQVSAVLTLWFVAWEAGAQISKVFARQAEIRRMAIERTNQIMNPVYGGAELVLEDQPEVLTPSGRAEVELQNKRVRGVM